MSTPTILLTGYGPYGDVPVNPCQAVVEMLQGETIAGAKVAGLVPPSEFFGSIKAVTERMAELKPDGVVMLGEFSGRAMITVERIAQNLNDATRYGLADDNGHAPTTEKIAEDGPVAYWSNAPIRAMVKAMREAGIPADISDAAGTLMCNHLMYGVLHHIATNNLSTRAAWLHLPTLPENAARVRNLGMPSMSAETSAIGVRAAIRALVDNREDLCEPSPSRLQI